jgi:hypothetical protein
MTVIDPPVDAMFGAGGMEYPTFVTTMFDSVLMRPGMRLPEFTTVHEIGHNWFQGILASNEPEEAWLDEGINEWADIRVMRDLYGPRKSGLDWLGWQADARAFEAWWGGDPAKQPAALATAAYAYIDQSAYYTQTYQTTARAFATLEGIVGSAPLMAAMKTYAKEFAFKHPTGRDLFATIERSVGQDLSWYFGPVFQSVGGIKLSVRDAECRRSHPPRGLFGDAQTRKTVTETEAPESGTYTCTVVIQNTGVVHVPVEIELAFVDGSTQRLQWDDRGSGSWKKFVVERSTPLAQVTIDPDDKIALADPTTHQIRIDPNENASLRAAARMSFWAQSLMQLVGP